jgi:hypothetical protein
VTSPIHFLFQCIKKEKWLIFESLLWRRDMF